MSKSLHLDGLILNAANYGNQFVLLKLLKGEEASEGSLSSLGQAILEKDFPFVDEVIATEVEICLKLNHNFQADSLKSIEQLRFSKSPEASTTGGQPVRLPVWFSDSDDWHRVSEHSGLSRGDYIRQLLACPLQVAMLGFLPGFVYLGGLPAELRVPRKTNPDKRTAAGAFAIGGKYAGVYSLPSPAGWNVIGQLGIELLQTETLPPIELKPGVAIRLEQVDRHQYEQLTRTRPTLDEYKEGQPDGQ